jgi:S1-C subfamily serine protease
MGVYGGTDMKNAGMIFAVLAFSLIVFSNAHAKNQIDMTEAMKNSIVYLDISYYGYEQYQPWKNKELTANWGVGCAVAENQVITTAYNVANAVEIKVKRFGQNEFIPAKIKIVDYESNLALLELDPNTLKKALIPVKFSAKYKKGASVNFYWLSATEQTYSGRGFLDRATVDSSQIAFSQILSFVAANISDITSNGQLYCIGAEPLGIAYWSNDKEAGIIPAEAINRFLSDAKDGAYNGIGAAGFLTTGLLDPALRKYLKLPEKIQYGIYVSDVYTIGTGCNDLKTGDVLLAVDGFKLNPYGRYIHPQYDSLSFDYLITSKTAGEKITFDIWRDGKEQTIEAIVKNFDVSQMLVPWYDLDSQPEYFIIGGCVLQKLTKTYLEARGAEWAGKTEPHIYNYLLNKAFKPTDTRKAIIVLSFVLPGNINLGYHGLGQLVVDNINGMKIGSMKDIPKALALNPNAKYDIIEFELSKPKIVLDRGKMPEANLTIAKTYGIDKPANIK